MVLSILFVIIFFYFFPQFDCKYDCEGYRKSSPINLIAYSQKNINDKYEYRIWLFAICIFILYFFIKRFFLTSLYFTYQVVCSILLFQCSSLKPLHYHLSLFTFVFLSLHLKLIKSWNFVCDDAFFNRN